MEDRKTLCKEEFTNCEIVKENKQLQDKLKKIEEYINFLVIFEPNIGRFNKTIWGEEILSIIKGDE